MPIFVLITSLKREITNKEFLLSNKNISIEKGKNKTKMQTKHYCEVNYSLLTISPQSLCQFCSLHNDVRQLLHTKCYQQIQVSTEASPVVKCLYTKPSDPRVQVEPICTNYSLPKSSKLKPSDIVSNLLLSPWCSLSRESKKFSVSVARKGDLG